MCYFCRPGGLAELVDCTGLENRRAARYRGFESLSLRQESVHDVGTFFLPCHGFTSDRVITCTTPCKFESVNNSDSTSRFVRGALLKGFGFAMGLTLGTAALAQQDWRTDALVQRLPNGQAYLEVQTAWESDLSASGDSVTLTVIVSRQDDLLGFRKSRLEVRPDVPDSSALMHFHVDRIPVPDGSCAVEWSVERDDVTLLSSNLTYRIAPGGMPEIADPMVVATHARASEMSDANMVHSGMDLIPSVGKHISHDQAAAKIYVELHKMDEVVGRDSLFLLAYGWADAQGNWDATFTKFKRLEGSIRGSCVRIPPNIHHVAGCGTSCAQIGSKNKAGRCHRVARCGARAKARCKQIEWIRGWTCSPAPLARCVCRIGRLGQALA